MESERVLLQTRPVPCAASPLEFSPNGRHHAGPATSAATCAPHTSSAVRFSSA